MKNLIVALLLGFIVFSCTPIAQAEEVVPMTAGVSNEANSETFISKIDGMAGSFHQVAIKIAIPLTIIVLVIGAILGIFVSAARKMALFAIIALVIVFWAPLLVGMVVNWIS